MACNCISQNDFSASNIHENGCPLQIPGECSFYSGLAIPSMGIQPGDTFNTVVRKIAIYVGAITGDITDLQEAVAILGGDTTSTTTSSSTTTTTTTSAIHSIVYIGSNDTGTPPDSTAILAGITSTQDETQDVVANWTSFNAAPHYLWFAIKVNGTPSNKNQWFESVSNFGSIGTVDDTFGALTTVTVSAVSYYVGITNFATQFTSSVLLKHV